MTTLQELKNGKPWLEAFIDSTAEVMHTMAMIEVSCSTSATSPVKKPSVGAMMELNGDNRGFLALQIDETTAKDIIGIMMAKTPDELDAEAMQGGVGEIVNMIGGSAKARLGDSEFAFELTVPIPCKEQAFKKLDETEMPVNLNFQAEEFSFCLKVSLLPEY